MEIVAQRYFLLLILFLCSFVVSDKNVKGLLIALSWFCTGGFYWLCLCYHTIGRDCRLYYRGFRLTIDTYIYKFTGQTLVDVFRNNVKKYPNDVMFYNDENGQEWTFKQAEEHSNRICNYFLSLGYRKGDCIALYMENKAEYVFIWLGLAKAGIICALINCNLSDESLLHTIKAAKASALIYDAGLESSVTTIIDNLIKWKHEFPTYYYLMTSKTSFDSNIPSSMSLVTCLETSSSSFPMGIALGLNDPLFYIYTSGTTGLPKAVIIKHSRQLLVLNSVVRMIQLKRTDIMYCYLPLYHASGSQVGIANSMINGGKTIIKKKFSASNFWKDAVKYNVTITQYIGEICRFLLGISPCPEEKAHSIRLMMGNGLRPQIWTLFTSRFSIPNIAEFYGATEGNCTLLNIENQSGAVGFLSVIFPKFFTNYVLPLKIVKVDSDTMEPLRNSRGFLIECETDEPGEIIGKIIVGNPLKGFEGYTESSENKKKIIQNAFINGDLYFRSGDIVVKDEFGYISFCDRSGDTFRWKGENVSAAEVETVLSKILQTQNIAVYGVEIPNCDGKAGMALISNISQDSLQYLSRSLLTKLPSYARPQFLRLTNNEMDLTGTFKIKKRSLAQSGFNPTLIQDSLLYFNNSSKSYEVLTEDIYNSILKGTLRF